MDKKERDLENAWATNEGLLQGYRSTFIGSQSFLLAIGVLLLDKSLQMWMMLVMALISGGIIVYIWIPVVRARALIVDYYKIQLDHDFSNLKNFCENEHIYIHNKKGRKLMNKEAGLESNWRLTRIKVDMLLPAIFFIIWVGLLITKCQMN